MNIQWIVKHFPELKEMGIALLASLILPIVVLMLDYFIRSKIQGEQSWRELVKFSGPDCCVLSMGATGAIFVDPNVSAIRGLKSPIFAVFLVLFLIAMRVACINKPKIAVARNGVADIPVTDEDTTLPANLKFGVWSLATIAFVVAYGYFV